MKSFVGYLSMISMGVIASVVLANGTLGPGVLLGAISGSEPAQMIGPANPVNVDRSASSDRTALAQRSETGSEPAYVSGAPSFKLDYASLILGLVIGVLLSSLASFPWSQIPRRTANWLVSNQANFGYGLLSLAFAALLIYY
jgi:hypothetical protein